jgi:hypothetical protein
MWSAFTQPYFDVSVSSTTDPPSWSSKKHSPAISKVDVQNIKVLFIVSIVSIVLIEQFKIYWSSTLRSARIQELIHEALTAFIVGCVLH